MSVPVFRETICFAYLSCITIAIRAILSFDKGGVDDFADSRSFQRRFNFNFGSKDGSQDALKS